ncbi:MAG: hypothetical protein KF753_08460 [Caldilineaceae bacterium]|nr:hypothetical protein [Caldilineaceae bacterium]
MTTLTIEVPDELMAKLAQQERSIQEIVVDLLEDAFANGRKGQPITIPPEEEAIRHLYQTGFLTEAENLDDELADEWDNLPDKERQTHLGEVDALVLKDSALSRYIIENRRQ